MAFTIEEVENKVREPDGREKIFIISHIMEKDGVVVVWPGGPDMVSVYIDGLREVEFLK